MITLLPEEELGLQIMALHNMGMLADISCTDCNRQESLNCNIDDSESPVFSSPEFGWELTTCPFHYVPNNILQFIDEYYYYENYNGQGIPTYDDMNGRFHCASKMYRGYIAKLTNIKNDNTNTTKQNSGLGSARAKYLKQ